MSPIDRQQQRRPAGLLLSTLWAGDICQHSATYTVSIILKATEEADHRLVIVLLLQLLSQEGICVVDQC